MGFRAGDVGRAVPEKFSNPPAPVHLELKPICSPTPNPNPVNCFIYQVNRTQDCTSHASKSEDNASLASQTTVSSAPPSDVHPAAIGKIIPKANALKRQCSLLLQRLDECESEPEEEQSPRLSARIEPTPDGHAPSSIKTEHQELATPEMMPCEIATPDMQPEWPVKAEAGCAACCLRKENARARARHKILEAQFAKRYIYIYVYVYFK